MSVWWPAAGTSLDVPKSTTSAFRTFRCAKSDVVGFRMSWERAKGRAWRAGAMLRGTAVAALGIAMLTRPAWAMCGVPEVTDMPVTIGIETHGHHIGGTGIVTMTELGVGNHVVWSLTLLSPGGLAMFTATGSFREDVAETPPTITTGLDAWKPWLEKLPLGRDLRVAFQTEGDGQPGARRDREACAGGTVRTRFVPSGDTEPFLIARRHWHGPGGPARALVYNDRVILHDPLRGYTLTIVAPARQLPHAPYSDEE